MKYPELQGICKYCIGCNRLETEFKGVLRCSNFTAFDKNWYEKYRKELKKN